MLYSDYKVLSRKKQYSKAIIFMVTKKCVLDYLKQFVIIISTENKRTLKIRKEGRIMALSDLNAWRKNSADTGSSCGTGCGASDKPAEQPAACGASDKPASCGSACGAGDK
jgi:ACGX-repeat protein